ncbi:hypothetical protein EHS25_005532 [Saitozyma podzolica]|uniref:Uncharacterized protein n=1 Tax=Saitozyma podzolica TaxID=1890683 RepID=A0A427XXM4_9TREE|nr:hypothetical protein EHS25_005532 [Saitozyma podzolica]
MANLIWTTGLLAVLALVSSVPLQQDVLLAGLVLGGKLGAGRESSRSEDRGYSDTRRIWCRSIGMGCNRPVGHDAHSTHLDWQGDECGFQVVGRAGEASDPGHSIPQDAVQLVPEVDEVAPLEGALQVPQVLLHAYPQDNEGVLVGNRSRCTLCSHAGPQHPEAIGEEVLKGKHLALGRVEAYGWFSLTREDQRLFQCRVVWAEDVDAVKVGHDEPVWAEGRSQVADYPVEERGVLRESLGYVPPLGCVERVAYVERGQQATRENRHCIGKRHGVSPRFAKMMELGRAVNPSSSKLV